MSPSKTMMGGPPQTGENSIAAILARAGVAAKKGGLTIGSKEMSKLGKGTTPSQGGKS